MGQYFSKSKIKKFAILVHFGVIYYHGETILDFSPNMNLFATTQDQLSARPLTVLRPAVLTLCRCPDSAAPCVRAASTRDSPTLWVKNLPIPGIPVNSAPVR